MQKSRRATNIWLIMIGLIMLLVFISGAFAPQVMVAMLAAYGLLVLFGSGLLTSSELRERLPSIPQREAAQSTARRKATQTSSAALKAANRAKSQPGFLDQFELLDIGLIVNTIDEDGLHLRRGRVTLDDQGIQPYVAIKADQSWQDEVVTARFEVLDQKGDLKFVWEEEVYLRAGQNNILSTNRLPLFDNAGDFDPGMWELRVTVAESLVGLHTFGVGPSMEQRRRMVAQDVARRRARLRDDDAVLDVDDDSPVSLEDLLRGKQ
jgi:hypothetical protein